MADGSFSLSDPVNRSLCRSGQSPLHIHWGLALKFGVVGYSLPDFDHRRAKALLEEAFDLLITLHRPENIQVVSGLTNVGIPRLAYELGQARNYRCIGISSAQALAVKYGLWPVDEQIIVGIEFGDESQAFIDCLDVLIRIGGGPQSLREVHMFQQKCLEQQWAPDCRLVEQQLPRLTEYAPRATTTED